MLTKSKIKTIVSRNSCLSIKTTINTRSESKVICMTFKEIKEISSQLKTPEFQTDLNEDKVLEMVESYKNNPHHFCSRCLITIAHNIVGSHEEYLVVDGQHRIEMAIKLFEENINNTLLVAIVDINSKSELDKLFQDINKDSAKCLTNYYGIFEKQTYEELKSLIINDHNFLSKSSSIKKSLYSPSEFIDILINKNIIKTLQDEQNLKETKEIYNYMRVKEKEFYNKIGYLEQYHTNKDLFKISEIKSIEDHSCMFIKNNNFIDFLSNNKVKPNHNYKKRESINKELQKQVWEKEFESKTSGKCPIYNCSKILSLDISNSWQCGHIISVSNNGKSTLENLRPICPPCNQIMSSTNWPEWEETIMCKDIIEDYFENGDEIVKCKIKNCKNKLTIDNFKPYLSVKTKKVKPICINCYNN